MPYISLVDKQIEVRFGHGETAEVLHFPATEEGAQSLWNTMLEKNDLSATYSSSVDFPEDAGLPEDFNLDGMLNRCNKRLVDRSILKIFGDIDKMVEKGNIKELAERSKRFVLLHFDKDPDDYHIKT